MVGQYNFQSCNLDISLSNQWGFFTFRKFNIITKKDQYVKRKMQSKNKQRFYTCSLMKWNWILNGFLVKWSKLYNQHTPRPLSRGDLDVLTKGLCKYPLPWCLSLLKNVNPYVTMVYTHRKTFITSSKLDIV